MKKRDTLARTNPYPKQSAPLRMSSKTLRTMKKRDTLENSKPHSQYDPKLSAPHPGTVRTGPPRSAPRPERWAPPRSRARTPRARRRARRARRRPSPWASRPCPHLGVRSAEHSCRKRRLKRRFDLCNAGQNGETQVANTFRHLWCGDSDEVPSGAAETASRRLECWEDVWGGPSSAWAHVLEGPGNPIGVRLMYR